MSASTLGPDDAREKRSLSLAFSRSLSLVMARSGSYEVEFLAQKWCTFWQWEQLR